MTFFHVKTLIAIFLVAAGVTAALSMLTLMGKSERKLGVMTLRNTHRAAGYTFVALLVVLAIMGLRHLAAAGDTLSLRGVLHWVLGSLLVFLLLLKLLVVRVYKQFLKFVPVMGMMVITLALLVATLSAGFFAVTGGRSPGGVPTGAASAGAVQDAEAGRAEARSPGSGSPRSGSPGGDAERGRAAFATNCSGCHNADSTEPKIGPGLAGLFGRETFKVGGKPINRENVRGQIKAPPGTMPPFGDYLSDEEVDDIVAYLETL